MQVKEQTSSKRERLSKQYKAMKVSLEEVQKLKEKYLEEFSVQVQKAEEKINLLQQKIDQNLNNEQKNSSLKLTEKMQKAKKKVSKQQEKLDTFKQFQSIFDIQLKNLQNICEQNTKTLESKKYNENYYSLDKIIEEAILQLHHFQYFECVKCFKRLIDHVKCIKLWYGDFQIDEKEINYQKQFDSLVEEIENNLNKEENEEYIQEEKKKQQKYELQKQKQKNISQQQKKQNKKVKEKLNFQDSQESEESQDDSNFIDISREEKDLRIAIKELNKQIIEIEDKIKYYKKHYSEKNSQKVDLSQLHKEKQKLKSIQQEKKVKLNTIIGQQKIRYPKVEDQKANNKSFKVGNEQVQPEARNNEQQLSIVESVILQQEQFKIQFKQNQVFDQKQSDQIRNNFHECFNDKVINRLIDQFQNEKNSMCQICGQLKNQHVPIPCQHYICCSVCQVQELSCFFCDMPIQFFVKIFD